MYNKYFRQLREQAILRDKEKCVICGVTREEYKKKKKRDFDVHHIEGTRNDLDNLETLCHTCHVKKERYLHKKNIRKMIKPINLHASVDTLFKKDPVINYTAVSDPHSVKLSLDPNSTTAVYEDSYSGSTGVNYYGHYWNWWESYADYHYHYYHWHPTSDKFEKAFKISRKLMEKKLVKPMKTVEDFFKLMDGIVEALKEF